MTETEVEDLIRNMDLDRAIPLWDGYTYKIPEKEMDFITKRPSNAWIWPTKMLVLTDGRKHVVGGIVFFGANDIQAQMLQEYKNKGHMSRVHKNGILRAELYDDQRVSIDFDHLESFDDFKMKMHLLRYIGLVPNNLKNLYWYMKKFNYPGIENYHEDNFMREFS